MAIWSAATSASSAWRGHCLNLSEGGAAVVVAREWLRGQVVIMELALPGYDQPLRVTARVAHCEPLFSGFEFLAAGDDVESALRALARPA